MITTRTTTILIITIITLLCFSRAITPAVADTDTYIDTILESNTHINSPASIPVKTTTMSTTTTTASPTPPTKPALYTDNQVFIIEPKGEHKHTLFWLHGLGDSGYGAMSLVKHFDLQHTKIILPTAPGRQITAFGQRPRPTNAWFDVLSMGQKRDLYQDEDFVGMRETIAKIHAAIEYEITTTNIPAQSIALAGFSQGSGIGIAAAVQYPGKERLGGALGFCGFAIMSKLSPDDEAAGNVYIHKDTPILTYNGLADQIVSPQFARGSVEYYKTRGLVDVESLFEEGLQHTMSQAAVAKGRAFLEKIGFT